ncbi:MAG: XDD3 family exosortase-dependent surface protein [Cyanobacteriota bacterium]|nr:XDD3 family exosortase-dependent surface protein [Cyanobacteriota bacterium]
MTQKNLAQLVGSATVLACTLVIAAPQARAGQLYQDWNYGIDAVGDGSGGSKYDIKGLAVKQTADSIFVGLTGGSPITGASERSAADGNVGFGDLFFNFSGKDFQTAEQDGDIFGIRFAGTNDSGASQVGLYSNVSTKSVTSTNAGYDNLKRYYDKGYGKANTMGTDIATESEAYTYLYGADAGANPTNNNTTVTNVIDSGNFLGGINLLDGNQLASAGLDFGHFNASGSHTFGFQFDKSLLSSALPGGISPFVAHLLMECANDAIALKGNIELEEVEVSDVPEPATAGALGLLATSILGLGKKRKKVS